MTQEYYGIASTPTDDFLAHYGVRGMKWGVRKAIASGNSKRLGRQFDKAQKKLAKLDKRAAKASKYAKRAALYGAGAAAAGGLAALGTSGVSSAVSGLGTGVNRAGLFAQKFSATRKLGRKISKVGNSMKPASRAIADWGKSNSIGTGIQNAAGRIAGNVGKGGKAAFNTASRDAARNLTSGVAGMSNNALARIGAGAVGVGLAGAAARNAYRAATAKKKAARFRSEMNKAFSGTKYAGQISSGPATVSSKKKRRR